ncbi:MAG: hypothetical protein WBP81_34480 [Solirubrobacteraceae bacterium]
MPLVWEVAGIVGLAAAADEHLGDRGVAASGLSLAVGAGGTGSTVALSGPVVMKGVLSLGVWLEV